MKVRKPRYSKEEFARRGQTIYEQQVRAQVEEGNSGRIVAIDIETGEFEVADDPLAASDQLFARCPDAQPWLIRIGHHALHRFGASHAGVHIPPQVERRNQYVEAHTYPRIRVS